MNTITTSQLSKIYLETKNAAALIMGGAAKEGGNIEVYRDASNNLQFFVDADAASNAKAVDIYGGVVCQNYVTIGRSTLSTTYKMLIDGLSYFTGNLAIADNITVTNGKGLISSQNNISSIVLGNIGIGGTDSTNHALKIQIHAEDIIVAQATGDGAGSITNKAIGLYGVTPVVQAAHIANPAESTSENNAAIDAILVALENIGVLASS